MYLHYLSRFIECLSHLNTCSGNKMDIHIGDALTFNMQELFPPGIRCMGRSMGGGKDGSLS